MATSSISSWQYRQDQAKLPDPRIEIARHIGWITPVNLKGTPWQGIEPDNYNLAIFDDKPYDLKFMQHQCFYRLDRQFLRQRVQGWVSIYVAEERLQTILFNREILKIQPRATWRYAHAKLIRDKRTLLNREPVYSNRTNDNFTTEERLWQLGYYEKLQRKYFNGDERFIKVVGRPRGAVLNYVPEEHSTEVEDA